LFGFILLALSEVSFVCMKQTELRALIFTYCQTWVIANNSNMNIPKSKIETNQLALFIYITHSMRKKLKT